MRLQTILLYHMVLINTADESELKFEEEDCVATAARFRLALCGDV